MTETETSREDGLQPEVREGAMLDALDVIGARVEAALTKDPTNG